MKENDLEGRIEQLDNEEFKAAVRQLKLGDTALADKFMDRVAVEEPSNGANLSRMEYLVACTLTASGKHETAVKRLLSLAERLLGIEETTNCGCGAKLDDDGCFLNSKNQDVCEDCWLIEVAEDEDDE